MLCAGLILIYNPSSTCAIVIRVLTVALLVDSVLFTIGKALKKSGGTAASGMEILYECTTTKVRGDACCCTCIIYICTLYHTLGYCFFLGVNHCLVKQHLMIYFMDN